LENSYGERAHGRIKRRLEDNIKMDLTEIEWKEVDWFNGVLYKKNWLSLVKKVVNILVA